MKILKIGFHIILHMVAIAVVFVVLLVIAILLHKFIEEVVKDSGLHIAAIYAAMGLEYLLYIGDTLLFLYAAYRLMLSMVNEIREIK